MHFRIKALGSFDKQLSKLLAKWIRKIDMYCKGIEETALAFVSFVDYLIAYSQMPRRNLLDKRAHRAAGDDMSDPKLFQCVDIRTVGDCRRIQQMPVTMSAKKGNWHGIQLSADIGDD